MNAAKQAAWLLGVLVLMACSGWYFASKPAPYQLDDKTLSLTADNMINDLSVQQFDETGLLVHRLQTPLLRHIPKDNTNLLSRPRIYIIQPNQAPWDIQSEEATALHGGKRIIFKNQVVVHQQKGEHNQESTLRTEEITYFPKTQKATTSLFVKLEQPGSVIESIGMKAYLSEKRVELLNSARGRYVPNQG